MSISVPAIIQTRKDRSIKAISDISLAISRDVDLPDIQDLCIYITGSYGRLEAHEYSDLDLFFVSKSGSSMHPIPKVDKALSDSVVIKACRSLKFPEFTKGGEYLEIHYMSDMLSDLGSPADDYRNLFTARMLLLLESRPVLRNENYDDVILDIIQTYFRDYHRHETNFSPAFLVNDIQRYWKTMCLNYEHRRNRADMPDRERNKSHLKNLKLKYSRLLTCFSMIGSLLSERGRISPEAVNEFVHLSPIDRLIKLAESDKKLRGLVEALLDQYAYFLSETGKDEDSALAWISDRDARDDAFGRARGFGQLMFKILKTSCRDEERLRYLVI